MRLNFHTPTHQSHEQPVQRVIFTLIRVELSSALVDNTTIETPAGLLFCRDCQGEWRIGAEQVEQSFGVSPDNVNVRIRCFVILALLVIDHDILLEILDHI